MVKVCGLSIFPILLKNAQIAWKTKTPYQKWRSFYKFCDFLGELLQIRVFGNLKIGIIGFFPCVTGVVHYGLIIYTVCYYINRGYFVGCLPCFCIFGGVTSVNSDNLVDNLKEKITYKYYRSRLIVYMHKLLVKLNTNLKSCLTFLGNIFITTIDNQLIIIVSVMKPLTNRLRAI